VSLTTVFDIVFAAGAGVAVIAVAASVARALPQRGLLALAALELTGVAVAWVLFALRPAHERELAVAAGGITACALATFAAMLLRRALAQADVVEVHVEQARARLRAFVDEEAQQRAAELERTLARARADSTSLLAEEERRIAEERRGEFATREREATRSLTEALNATQAQVAQRLAAWAQDLDRAAETTKLHLAELAQRQGQLLSEVELRLTADAERLAADSEVQRAALQRLRLELDKAREDTLATARTDLDSHAAERRRALHELEERMRQRERELLERIEREEVEAGQRIRGGFEDVERRQLEQLARAVERATMAHADEAAQQFAALVKSSREDAARRLSRELDRAVEVFAREAEGVLAERLAHVGDAGAQRLERRLAEATAALERQRDERLGALDGRIVELEGEIRRRLEELAADAEAERAVIEARVQELLRRVEASGALQSS
jgi:hypothetical protein